MRRSISKDPLITTFQFSFTKTDALVLQVLDVTRGIRKGFRAEPLVRRHEFAIQGHGVVACGSADEPSLPEAGLLAVPPGGHQGDGPLLRQPSDAELFARMPLKGPGSIPARSHVPSEADLLKVGHALPDSQFLCPSLAVPVQLEAAAL